MSWSADRLAARLADYPRARVAVLPTPIHRLERFADALGSGFEQCELWIKRDDMTGFEGGGNKTRKLEFLAGDALERGADTLVTIGAIQSNHTRQTAAVAAAIGLRCALLHFAWSEDAGPHYRQVGNLLLSHLMGADLHVEETPRPIEDQGPLEGFCEQLRREGRRPYAIPGGASEHRLGSLGYVACALEIARQSEALERPFDRIVHCTGSSSTQAGLLAGFAALGVSMRVTGVADDEETEIKQRRVRVLANETLEMLGAAARVGPGDVEVLAVDQSPYGKAEDATLDGIRLLAKTQGLVADPVYEGKAVRGLMELARRGSLMRGERVLLMHLGGAPALHAYANQFGQPELRRFVP
ncbi:MAG: D-cysteine desulfhydrase family protein [Pseudomonadales bacterium]|jgi:1-aminocyclopropane-1-carboxylate deaminase|nr:D-cysteine desulfhydrase family protein [Pseudomonadales bacterium]